MYILLYFTLQSDIYQETQAPHWELAQFFLSFYLMLVKLLVLLSTYSSPNERGGPNKVCRRIGAYLIKYNREQYRDTL